MQGAQYMFAWLAAGDYDRMPGLPAMPGGIGGPGLGGMAGGGIGGGTIGGDCKAAMLPRCIANPLKASVLQTTSCLAAAAGSDRCPAAAGVAGAAAVASEGSVAVAVAVVG